MSERPTMKRNERPVLSKESESCTYERDIEIKISYLCTHTLERRAHVYMYILGLSSRDAVESIEYIFWGGVS